MKNALQQFKQKGRILRAYLSSAFGTEVKLTQAYEAVAKMEGAENWHVFSAQLAGKPVGQAVPGSAASSALYKDLPSVSAVFLTEDGQARATFDAKVWFDQATQGDIYKFLHERTDNPPEDFEQAYGGGECGIAIAEFFAESDEGIAAVLTYRNALNRESKDCGRLDCFIKASDVLVYMTARRIVERVAVDFGETVAEPIDFILENWLPEEEHAQLVADICAAIWQHCVDGWKDWKHSQDCEFIIQSTDIFNGLSDFNIVATGEDGYSDEVEHFIEDALDELGYHRQARLLYEGNASLDDVFPVVSEGAPAAPVEVKHDTLKVFEVMMQDIVGDYDVPDGIPEWEWVQRNAAFSHRRNGKEGGVWEFMVHSNILENDIVDIHDPMPARLKPLFEKACIDNASWIMFHQGT